MRKKRRKYRNGDREIEEVQCFKYLGFIFNRKDDYDHIIEKRLYMSKKERASSQKGMKFRIMQKRFYRR